MLKESTSWKYNDTIMTVLFLFFTRRILEMFYVFEEVAGNRVD